MYTCQELSTVPLDFQEVGAAPPLPPLAAVSRLLATVRAKPSVELLAAVPCSHMRQYASINQTILSHPLWTSPSHKTRCAFFPLPLFSASSAASRTAFAAFISLVETNSLLIRNVTLASMWLIDVNMTTQPEMIGWRWLKAQKLIPISYHPRWSMRIHGPESLPHCFPTQLERIEWDV